MKQVKTKDDSITFHNPEFDETYHSTSGAREEAVKKFVEPCEVARVAQTGKIKILDICFGLGYNTAAALDAIKENNPGCVVEIIALENDPEVIKTMLEVDSSVFGSYEILQTIILSKKPIMDNEVISVREGKFCFELLMGDARDWIKGLGGKDFDCVFLDPFSPKKCPELWTEEFFHCIFASMKQGGILATYSCARSVRDNLKKAGFEVRDGPSVGRKAPSTIAVKPR